MNTTNIDTDADVKKPKVMRFSPTFSLGILQSTSTLQLFLQTTIQTFVNDRLLLTEIREGGELRDAILLCESLVVDLDEVYSKGIRVVIDLLEFFQNFIACNAASRICWKFIYLLYNNSITKILKQCYLVSCRILLNIC